LRRQRRTTTRTFRFWLSDRVGRALSFAWMPTVSWGAYDFRDDTEMQMGCRWPRAHAWLWLAASNVNAAIVFRPSAANCSGAADLVRAKAVDVKPLHSLLRCGGLATNHRSVAVAKQENHWKRATPYRAGSAAYVTSGRLLAERRPACGRTLLSSWLRQPDPP
jgi:hypothetical protein